MTVMSEKEKEQIILKNPHLKVYLDNIRKKMKDPVFYSALPYEVRDEEFPNLIFWPWFDFYSCISDKRHGGSRVSCNRATARQKRANKI